MRCPAPWPLVAQRMELSSEQVTILRTLIHEGRELRSDSDPGDQVRWRVASVIYLGATVPAEHLMWKALPSNYRYYCVPSEHESIAPYLFGKYWGPLLGALEGLLALWETSGAPRSTPEGAAARSSCGLLSGQFYAQATPSVARCFWVSQPRTKRSGACRCGGGQ